MNDIEKLEERIAQLTELVKTGTETIESLKETLKTVEKERDRLAEERREREPKFERVGIGESYFYVFLNDYGAFIVKGTESNELLDRELYKTNNYFHTKERAQKVADKINLLLKLERLHDIYCPNYVPNWDNEDERKYVVYYDNQSKCYKINSFYVTEYKPDVAFPTSEIAQKVCDILNEELEEKK